MESSLSIALFLVSLITTQSICSAESIIKDATGANVLNNVPYHLGPVKGGRIKLTDKINNKKVCPFDVVQDPGDVNLGGKFTFTLFAKHEYLLTEYVLGINAGYNPNAGCDESTFWTVPDAEAKPPMNLITTGDGFQMASTCFQIVEYPKPTSSKVHSYMFQHCPSFCGAGPKGCFNATIYSDKNGVRRLVAGGGTPFEFVFYKASN